jgi:transcriptional regulator of acetoin/glycerol metabolism
VPGRVPVDRARREGRATLGAMIPAAETIDESQRFPEPTAGAVPGLVLIWISERPAATVLPLNQGQLELGRSAQEQLFAEDDRVSREHCRIQYDGTGWTVRDLDSRNGTFVNGERISFPFVSVHRPLVRVGRTLAWGVEDVRPYLAGVALEDDGLLIGGRLRSAWTEISLVGGTDSSLCLRGESGSGKELAARAYHRSGGAAAASPFIGINCAAIPEGLAERLLFGTRRGAFSGATGDVQGYIQAADGGTLFLDEVAELDLRVQAKLLRVLETKEVLPLGATRPERVELRVCVATHADLREEVTAGRFREDLYYRVGRPLVEIPPLRERLEELGWFVHGELSRADPRLGASVRFIEACALRHWPGNVRELLGEARRAAHRALQSDRLLLEPEDLSPEAGQRLGGLTSAPPPAEEPERGSTLPPDETIERVLAENEGNVSRAARALDMHRNQLRRWLAKRGIKTRQAPPDEP